jgi:hypothetical protein
MIDEIRNWLKEFDAPLIRAEYIAEHGAEPPVFEVGCGDEPQCLSFREINALRADDLGGTPVASLSDAEMAVVKDSVRLYGGTTQPMNEHSHWLGDWEEGL